MSGVSLLDKNVRFRLLGFLGLIFYVVTNTVTAADDTINLYLMLIIS